LVYRPRLRVVEIERSGSIVELGAHDKPRAVLRPIDDPRIFAGERLIERRLLLRKIIVEPLRTLPLHRCSDNPVVERVDANVRNVQRLVRVYRAPAPAIRGHGVEAVPADVERPPTDYELALRV
jgi:hypothetical protein